MGSGTQAIVYPALGVRQERSGVQYWGIATDGRRCRTRNPPDAPRGIFQSFERSDRRGSGLAIALRA